MLPLGFPPLLWPLTQALWSPPQAPERPLMGVNGLDVTSLRPFDLVIPFTIKKGEITGEWGQERAREPQRPGFARGCSDPGPAAPQGR